MKGKNSYIGIALIILLFGTYAIPKIVNRFKGTTLEKFEKVPDFKFVDQKGDTITNDSYLGKVYVLEFFFTTCPTICPIMNTKMVELQNEFFGNPNFGIASISINPEFDTPEVLQEYAVKYKVSNPNWHLLTGQPEQVVFDLANQGFKLYAGVGSKEVGGFEHSGLFALVDKEGYIRSRVDEHGNPIKFYNAIADKYASDQIQELKEDIKILLEE